MKISKPDLVVKKFEKNLIAQESNITEAGEKDATAETRRLFEMYKSDRHDRNITSQLRQKILPYSAIRFMWMLTGRQRLKATNTGTQPGITCCSAAV